METTGTKSRQNESLCCVDNLSSTNGNKSVKSSDKNRNQVLRGGKNKLMEKRGKQKPKSKTYLHLRTDQIKQWISL